MTVIDVELGAVLDALALPDREKDPNDGTVYYRGAIPSQLTRRDYGVVVTCVGAAGNPGAAAAARNLITRYRPRAILLMGIAAGIRGKVRIGDVVFSERVLSYEPAALVRRDGVSTSEPRPEIERIPHAILQDLMGYRSDQKRLQERFLRAGGVFPEPPPGKQEEYRLHVATGVHAHPGTIASGEKLLRDPSKLITLRSQLHGKVEVGEMEAAGLVEACRQGGVPWLVIRGISDFGDEFKNDHFHTFAARAAAAVLADFLEFGLDLGPASRAPAAPPDDRRDSRDPGFAAHNPVRPRGSAFVFGRPVDRDEDFVGRRHEQDLIRQAIQREQPVQILGESLMGKTSLLRWIQRHVLPSRPVVWLDPTRGLSPVSMMRTIAGALGAREQADRLGRPDASNDDAMLVLESMDPFVLLIDDADTLATLGKGFDVEFFNAIRSRVQNQKLTWVSASHRNLYNLFKQNGLTSAFLNDARKIWIGPLDEDAAADLARRTSSAPGHGDVVLHHAGGFAYCLQWLGDYLSLHGRSIEQACDAFVTEMEPLFQRWWGSLHGQERQALKRCAASEVRVADLDDRTRRMLRALVDRGLLAEHQGRFHVEGLAFREFVKYVD